jgi:hypothetical protein
MNLITEKFNKIKKEFDDERLKDEGNKVMAKVIEVVNELGQHFSTLNGGELAEIQMKLSGYKFYLADYVSELQRVSECLKLDIKEQRAKRWDEITETIKAEKGKVSNKEQIDNILVIETKELQNEQILYETSFYKYRLKLSAIDDILTAIVQQIASKKREIEQAKSI